MWPVGPFLVKYMGLSPSLPSHYLEEMGLAHLWFLWREEAKLGCLGGNKSQVTTHLLYNIVHD